MPRIGWYDVKTKIKHLIRSLFYSGFFQFLLSQIIASYIRFVILTSSKKYYNRDAVDKLLKDNKSFIPVTWHNRIALSHYMFYKPRKLNKKFIFNVVASNHGDGAIIGEILKNFRISVIYGSTQKPGSSKKGMDIANFRKIFKSLKGGSAVCITPDGPRGPRFEVGGEVSAIAKLTNVPAVAVSIATSRRKVFRSWDRFILPLPFSKLAVYFADPIYIDKKATEEDLKKINEKIKLKINESCRKADELVGVDPLN